MKFPVAGWCALIAAATMSGSGAPPQGKGSCQALASLTFPGATVTLAQTVAPGPFSPGAPADSAARPLTVPRAFCRVAATLRPSADSEIAMEVWMPSTDWNGKFQAVGNGAFNGAIGYPAMLAAVTRGYAAASTDTGHAGPSASFALGHPEKVADFGWRAVHEMTIGGKRIVTAYYDRAPGFSYWNGCSAGGRQAMKEAQRFPTDFDGIIAGAPGLDWTGRASQAVRVAQALQKNEGARLTPADAQVVHTAVVDACDALDGVKDGLIGDPMRCRFDPATLVCGPTRSTGCLTAAQVSTVRLLYSSVPNSTTKREVPGLAPGSELGWTSLGWSASARATGLDQFRYLVFRSSAWDISRFDAATDVGRAESQDDNTINALDPHVDAFLARGGRLIQYHGWSDPQIAPGASVQYYERVLQALGGAERVQRAYRLFMAPGMAHCGGGDGPNTFDMMGALEAWVERGLAPDRIVASHSRDGVVDRTRPLCPYPQVAAYTGAGSINEAAGFACRIP